MLLLKSMSILSELLLSSLGDGVLSRTVRNRCTNSRSRGEENTCHPLLSIILSLLYQLWLIHFYSVLVMRIVAKKGMVFLLSSSTMPSCPLNPVVTFWNKTDNFVYMVAISLSVRKTIRLESSWYIILFSFLIKRGLTYGQRQPQMMIGVAQLNLSYKW